MRLVLIVLGIAIAGLVVIDSADAHFVDYNNLRNHIRATNIEGWCGKPDSWVCSGDEFFVIVGDSWDNDGTSTEGSHSREWRASWEEHQWFNPLNDRRCEMYFREYHYEFAERYRGPTC